MRHVPSCVYISLRLSTAVTVPGVVVYNMERYTTGLHADQRTGGDDDDWWGGCHSVPARHLSACDLGGCRFRGNADDPGDWAA